MHSSFTRRALVALMAASGVVVGIASPASAAVETGEITAGTIEIGDDYEFDIANPDPAPCQIADADPEIEVDFNGNGGTLVTDIDVRRGFFQVPPTTGDWYGVDLSVYAPGDNTGTITGSTIDQDVALLANIYSLGTLDPEASCPAGTLACQALIQVGTTNGSWSGAGSTPPGTAVVDGSGTINAPNPVPCSDFEVSSQIHNETATVTDLTVVFP